MHVGYKLLQILHVKEELGVVLVDLQTVVLLLY